MIDSLYEHEPFGLKGVSLDLSRLVLMGHSFGGATALKTATEDNRVACVAVLDPWIFPLYKEIENETFPRVKVPTIIVNSGHFHDIVKNWCLIDAEKLFMKLKSRFD